MNVYELSLGFTKHWVAANDEKHAYEIGTDPEKFPDIHYLPFNVTKVEVQGHTINVTADAEPEKHPNDMNRDELKRLLKDRNIQFTAQWGEDKLRELALQTV